MKRNNSISSDRILLYKYDYFDWAGWLATCWFVNIQLLEYFDYYKPQKCYRLTRYYVKYRRSPYSRNGLGLRRAASSGHIIARVIRLVGVCRHEDVIPLLTRVEQKFTLYTLTRFTIVVSRISRPVLLSISMRTSY